MRRVAAFPEKALERYEYKGYLASGGGLRGKPTGLLWGFRERNDAGFLILHEMDLRITEGSVTMKREQINFRVRGRPARLFYEPQSPGGSLNLAWTHDGFYRQIFLYCKKPEDCNQRDWLIKVANQWD